MLGSMLLDKREHKMIVLTTLIHKSVKFMLVKMFLTSQMKKLVYLKNATCFFSIKYHSETNASNYRFPLPWKPLKTICSLVINRCSFNLRMI